MKLPEDKDSVIALYREGPDLLEKALADISEVDLDKSPKKGGWTIRQIVHHLADGDDIWKAGIKQALGNDKSEFSLDWYRMLSQDIWSERWGNAKRPVEESLALFKAIRAYVVQLIEHIPDGWNRTVGFREPNGEIKIVSVGFIIEMQANHVLHHIQQIESI